MSTRSRAVPRLEVVGTAVLFSTGGTAIKVAGRMTGLQVVCFRSAVAALAIALLVPAARRGWTRGTLLVGIAFAATLITFVTANKETTAANAIFLQETALVYVLLSGPLLLRERPRRLDVATIAVMALAIGCFFVGQPASGTAPHPALGNALALASGFGWAATIIGLRRLGRSQGAASAAAATVAGNVIAAAVALPFALPAGGKGSDWLVIAYLGVVQIGLAYFLLTRGISRVPAVEASLLLVVEPALSPVWAWAVEGERPGAWAIAGGCVILAATVAWNVLDARLARRAARAP